MRSSLTACLVFAAALIAAISSYALEGPVRMREDLGQEGARAGCTLNASRNGTCANYKWYNLCSGYIWIWGFDPGEAVGILFGGPQQPCVAPGNKVKRMITYFRNAAYPLYATVNVFLDKDIEGDGCPDGVLAGRVNLLPSLRWNCQELGVTIPAGVSHLIVRMVHGPCGPFCPSFATDRYYSSGCDPLGIPRSYYYGVNGSACVPWPTYSPTGRNDNFLGWLIIDSGVTGTENTSWGSIKGLFQ